MTANADLETKFIAALKESGVPVELAGPILDVARKHIVGGRYSPIESSPGWYAGPDEHDPSRLLRDLRVAHAHLFETGQLPRAEQSETSLTGLADALRDDSIEKGLDAIRSQPWRMRL